MIALVLAVTCMARDSIAQTAKESIDVPPHSRLLLRGVGSGDQVYGWRQWPLGIERPGCQAPQSRGIRHGTTLAGPTWKLKDGSCLKGRAPRNKLLPMRAHCRGCCLSRSAAPEDWGRYDLSSVPGRTGEMRLTVVVARAPCAELLTRDIFFL
jgi:hypothetical protein